MFALNCYEVSTTFCSLLLIFTINANIVNITQAIQHFVKHPEAVYQGLNGQRLYIPCIIRNLRGECLWIKNHKGISPITGKYVFYRNPSNGDCSINIYNLNLHQDEGDRLCVVTPSYTDDKGLTSDNVKVVVWVAPSHPFITNISINQFVTVNADLNNQIECVSQNGNPVPRIEWYINDQNVIMNSKTNTYMTISGSPKVISVLNYIFKPIHRNTTISCVSIHPTVNQTIKAFLKVMGNLEIIEKKGTSYGYRGTDTNIEQKDKMITIVLIIIIMFLAMALIKIFFKNKTNESKAKTQDIPITLAAVATQTDLPT